VICSMFLLCSECVCWSVSPLRSVHWTLLSGLQMQYRDHLKRSCSEEQHYTSMHDHLLALIPNLLTILSCRLWEIRRQQHLGQERRKETGECHTARSAPFSSNTRRGNDEIRHRHRSSGQDAKGNTMTRDGCLTYPIAESVDDASFWRRGCWLTIPIQAITRDPQTILSESAPAPYQIKHHPALQRVLQEHASTTHHHRRGRIRVCDFCPLRREGDGEGCDPGFVSQWMLGRPVWTYFSVLGSALSSTGAATDMLLVSLVWIGGRWYTVVY
jgi:hypothetical protein